MKFDDVKIGQILKDKYGNEYRVVYISNNDVFNSVCIECIKFNTVTQVDAYNKFNCVGQKLFVINDRAMLLFTDDGIGKFIKEQFYSSLALADTIEPIKINAERGKQKTFLLGHKSTIDKINLTLSDLELVKTEVKIGMKFSDSFGNIYTVIGYNNHIVGFCYRKEIIGNSGKSYFIDMKTWIPYKSDDDTCSLEEFNLYEGK